jgi:hypothetical protein
MQCCVGGMEDDSCSLVRTLEENARSPKTVCSLGKRLCLVVDDRSPGHLTNVAARDLQKSQELLLDYFTCVCCREKLPINANVAFARLQIGN